MDTIYGYGCSNLMVCFRFYAGFVHFDLNNFLLQHCTKFSSVDNIYIHMNGAKGIGNEPIRAYYKSLPWLSFKIETFDCSL